MKCYVVKGKYDVIYEGEILKVVGEGGSVEYQSDIKQYRVYDFDRQMWETWPMDNVHKNIYLSKERFKGLVKEYPSFETAKKQCESKLR